ncbi:MAG: VanZ family protein [Betaproteobacteria bacterium]
MPTELVPLLPFVVTEPWDKLGHFIWYAAITLLLSHITRRMSNGGMPMAVFLSVCAFGALDEICQSFVPGRSADLLDFIVNASAAALTVCIVRKTVCAESSAR